MLIGKYLENTEKHEKENQTHYLQITSVNLMYFVITFFFFLSWEGF